jgi:hypothetical protein
MVHLGDSSNDLWHSIYDGSDWSPNERIPNQSSKASPALAVLSGQLHMVHLGDSSNNLWHSIYDGSRWSPNERIPDQSSKASPALTLFGSGLMMVHLGNSSNSIWSSRYTGQEWTPNVRTAHESSKAPALLNGLMVYVEEQSTRLFESEFTLEGFFEAELIRDQTTKASPALAFVISADPPGGRRHMVHLGQSSNDLWHSTRV